MGRVVFVTGFPGFLGKRLVRELAQDPATEELLLLVEARFKADAERALPAKGSLCVGDICEPGLGLASGTLKRVTHAFHLAGAYNLALDREVGMRVNVRGTRNVLEALAGAPKLAHLAHVSTCAVSGTHPGPFSESDFDRGQRFANPYEETKYLAEAEVRHRWESLPVTIFRPSVIAGDSQTGEADKIDGPYYTYLLISRGLWRLVPQSEAPFNVVPVDFAIQAMRVLSRPEHAGGVFHLADPAPLTFDRFLEVTLDAFGARKPWLKVPAFALRPFAGLARWAGVPAESLDYLARARNWRCEATTAALGALGMRCPPYEAYAKVLIDAFRTRSS